MSAMRLRKVQCNSPSDRGRNKESSAMRIVFAILAGAFLLLIVRAMAQGDFAASGAWLTSDPWGIVTLADLYLGFVLFGSVIALVESRWTSRLVWLLPLPFLGNVWAAVWLVMRWPVLRQKLTSGTSTRG
jgi:hypothetical protein